MRSNTAKSDYPFFGDLHDLSRFLRTMLYRRALVCTGPDRTERCDAPAVRIFWQDGAEWYPCCEKHWPEGSQWQGHTRFTGGSVPVNLFEERFLAEDRSPGDTIEKYDRTEAA